MLTSRERGTCRLGATTKALHSCVSTNNSVAIVCVCVCVCQRHRVLSLITDVLVSSASFNVIPTDAHATCCIGRLLVIATTTRQRIEPVFNQAI